MLFEKTEIKQVDYIRESVDYLILKYQEKMSENLIKNVKGRFHKE